MIDSALSKIDRAAKHIAELNELLRKKRPFVYILERNYDTGECATLPKRNEAVLHEATLICGDAIHNLRSALDYAYWEIVSPHVPGPERKSIQFPFSEEQKDLRAAVANRLAQRVSKALSIDSST